MAIKPNDTTMKKKSRKLGSNISNCSSKIYFTLNDNISRGISCGSKNNRFVSPYLSEKKISQDLEINTTKKKKNFVTSCPLAVNIYKANSDEFKDIKQRQKKHRKSVLTLPNKPAPLPQTSTVSERNDSEYSKEIKFEQELKPKYIKYVTNKRKDKDVTMEFNDGFHTSRLNINSDCSSIYINKNIVGDGIKRTKKINNKKDAKKSFHESNLRDVWSIIRNINKIQFKASPTISENSDISLERKKIRNNSSELETKDTEEFAYFSCCDINNSRDSSGRITVIDKLDDANEEKNFFENNYIIGNITFGKEKNRTFSDRKKPQNTKTFKKNCANVINKENYDSQNNCNIKSDIKIPQWNEKSRYENIKDWIKNIHPKISSQCNTYSISSLQLESITSRISMNNNDNKDFVTPSSVTNYSNVSSNSKSTKSNLINLKTGNKSLLRCTENNKRNMENKQEINGITKIILNKSPSNVVNKQQTIRLRMINNKPFANPKLTKVDVKRRLDIIKFPIVILGKDEVSSSFPVVDIEIPQFSGLDEKIWPFMINWSNTPPIITKDFKRISNDNLARRPVHNDMLSLKNGQVPKLFRQNNNVQSNKKAIQAEINSIQSKKGTMFKILQRKYSISVPKNSKIMMKDFTRNTSPTSESKFVIPVKTTNNNFSPPMKYSWARAKQTSDFIDKIVKRIKKGVYYSQELKDSDKKSSLTTAASTQTIKQLIENDVPVDTVSQISLKIKEEDLTSIPGFQDNLSNLKIEAFNRNQISIKHSITNVIITFDIVIPTESKQFLQLRKSISPKPITVIENKTKIYKCNKIILNTILPAELCSILPSMMHNLFDFKRDIPTIQNKITTTEIKAISDFHKHEMVDNVIVPNTRLSNKFEGKFPMDVLHLRKKKQMTPRTCIIEYKTDICPQININIVLECKLISKNCLYFDLKQRITPIYNVPSDPKPICMDLQPYVVKNKQLLPAYKRFTIMDVVWKFLYKNYFISNIRSQSVCLLQLASLNNHLNTTPDINIEKNKFNFDMLKLCNESRITSIEEKLLRIDKKTTILRNRSADNLHNLNNSHKIKSKSLVITPVCCGNKRRNSRQHMRCKSAYNITEYRSNHSLNKISSIDDFFQVLGSAKTLCNVLDKDSERIILSSLSAMKTWISDITPTQALLVLFLATKKLTTNLVRYRLLILQGIAVNRITKVSELDMEIEVIENERFNKLSQLSPTNYFPGSIDNQDTLLEELIWIAKTTASDFQKPFDECSERHIRSLLEKRKKLNPSYLRVMARYVGLGLLKTPK